MSNQAQISGDIKIRNTQGPLVANAGVVDALNGTASQYVRGDGTLADFPSSSGGGSSVSYYLNGSVSQGTLGGVDYKELSKVPIIGTGTNFSASVNGYVASFITDVNDPDLTSIPGGNFNIEFYFSASSAGGTPGFYIDLFKYDGVTFTPIASGSTNVKLINQGTVVAGYFSTLAVPTTSLTATDRIAIRVYVNTDGKTITLYTEDNRLGQVITTFSNGLTSLNNLTDQVQFFATGLTGTNFNISSVDNTHTFNLPTASSTARGALSSSDWSLFNNKVPYTGATGNMDFGEYGIKAGWFGLDTTPTSTPITEGTMSWNNTDGTMDLMLKGGLVTLQVGQEEVSMVYNDSGSILSSGDIVYVKGAVGNRVSVGLASNASEAESTATFGMVTQTIAIGAEGFVTTFGRVRDLDTLGFTAGDVVYLGSTPGSITNIKPIQPSNLVTIGYVERIDALLGAVFVKIQNGYELEELHDVLVTSVANNQGIFWDTATSLWKNKSIATALGYTPANDSLVVHLAGTETITGAKTFTAQLKSDALFLIKESVILSSVTGYTSISATDNSFTFINGANNKQATFVYTGLAYRSYTLPNINGTLALTSDIPSLTGYVTGTGTTNYLSKFTGTSTIANSLVFDNGTNVGIGTTLPAAKLHISSPSSSVFLDDTDSLSTINRAQIICRDFDDIQQLRFQFSTTENTATKLSMVLTQLGTIGFGTVAPERQLDIYNANDAYIKFNGQRVGNNLYTIGNDANGFVIYDDSNSLYRFVINQNGSVRLNNYTTNGFVKFSGSDGTLVVDTNTYALNSALGDYVTLATNQTITGIKSFTKSIELGTGSLTTGIYSLYKTNDTYLYIGVDDSTGSIFGNGAYSSSIYSSGTANMLLYTSGTARILIGGTTGNVLIGTTTDSGYKLSVNGTSNFVGAANFESILSIVNTSTSVGINIDRGSSILSNGIVWKTLGTLDWFLGSSPLGSSTSDLSLYSYGTASIILNISRSTGAATFASSITSSNFIKTISADQSAARIVIQNTDITGKNVNLVAGNPNTSQSGFSIAYDNTNILRFENDSAATFASSVTASSLIKSGGTSAQILAADGSVITAGTNITISGGTISSSGGGGGSISLAAIGSTPNANAATLTGSVLNLEPASASFGGVVTTGTQTFAGNKTFNGNLTASSTNYSNLILDGTNATNWGTNIAYRSLGVDFGYIGSIGSLLGNTTKSMTIWTTAGNGFLVYTNGGAKRLEITSGGSIGINNPTGIGSTLQVNGNAAIGYSASYAVPMTQGLAIYAGATIGFQTAVTTSPNNGLAVSGSVGIGVNSASGKLDISNVADCYVNILSATSATSSVLTMYNSTGTTDGAAIGYNVAMRFGTVTGSNAAGFTERMRITSTGAVGIGTSTPGYTATSRQVVAINGGAAAGQGSILAFMQAGVNKGYVFSIQNNMEVWCESGILTLGTNAAAALILKTSNADRLTVTATGNIGIGLGVLSSKFHVNGNAAIGYPSSTTAPNNGLAVSGNLGVGTSAPTTYAGYSTLAVNGTTGGVIDLMNNGTVRGQMSVGATDLYVVAVGASSQISFLTSALTRAVITSGGQLSLTTGANVSAIAQTGYSLTGANAQSLLDLAGTWNTTGNPTAIKLNITNTASGVDADLMELQVGGVAKFKVDKGGATSIGGSFTAPVSTKTASYTLNGNDYTIVFSLSSAILTASLPDASTCAGRIYNIKQLKNASVWYAVVDPSGTQTIDGQATYNLGNCNSAVTIQSDGVSNWHIISQFSDTSCL